MSLNSINTLPSSFMVSKTIIFSFRLFFYFYYYMWILHLRYEIFLAINKHGRELSVTTTTPIEHSPSFSTEHNTCYDIPPYYINLSNNSLVTLFYSLEKMI